MKIRNFNLTLKTHLVIIVFVLVNFLHTSWGNANSSTADELKPEVEVINIKWCGVFDHQKNQSFLTTRIIPARISEEKTNFSAKLVPGSVSCPAGVNTSLFTMHFERPFRNKRPFYESEFSSTGYFRAGDYYYPPDDYCITKWTEPIVTVRVCGRFDNKEATVPANWSYPECGVKHPCLPKCCAMNKLFTLTAGQLTVKCQEPFENSRPFDPILYNTPFEKTSIRRPVAYFRNRLSCDFISFIHESNRIDYAYRNATNPLCFRIRSDGKLTHRDENYNWIEIPSTDYCTEGIQLDGSLANLPKESFLGEEKHYGVLVCVPPQNDDIDANYWYAILYGSAILVGAVFLLLTFGVYVLLWREHRIQGWITMSHSATMFFMYCFLASNHLLELPSSRPRGQDEISSLCVISGVLTHYFFLSNFCWLTVICFNLFWSFRDNNGNNPQSKVLVRFIVYATFGWGVPLVFVGISVMLDQLYALEPCNMVIVPEYGQTTCTVSMGALGPYMYYPVALLLILNVLLFCATSYKLCTYQKRTALTDQNLNSNKELFQLITKLVIVMGLTWIFEFISWWHKASERTWYWAIVDMINILQAVAIFIIYVCNSNVAGSLRNEYPQLGPLFSVAQNSLEAEALDAETSATHFGSIAEPRERESLEMKNIKSK